MAWLRRNLPVDRVARQLQHGDVSDRVRTGKAAPDPSGGDVHRGLSGRSAHHAPALAVAVPLEELPSSRVRECGRSRVDVRTAEVGQWP